jgi:phage terminase large subunit GpA-like protein
MTATTPALERIFTEGLRSAIPEGELTISEWAERYRFVSPQRSARPGRWDNSVVPFARGIMDAVTEPDVRKVVFMKSSQVAGTEILINILCYYIHIDPSLDALHRGDRGQGQSVDPGGI